MNKQCNLNKHDSFVVVLQRSPDDNTRLLCQCSHFLRCCDFGGTGWGAILICQPVCLIQSTFAFTTQHTEPFDFLLLDLSHFWFLV